MKVHTGLAFVDPIGAPVRGTVFHHVGEQSTNKTTDDYETMSVCIPNRERTVECRVRRGDDATYHDGRS